MSILYNADRSSQISDQNLTLGQSKLHLNSEQMHRLRGHSQIKVGIRPEYVDVHAQAIDNSLPAQVERVQDLGTSVLMTMQCAGQVVKARLPLNFQHFEVGSNVHIRLLGKHTCFYHDEELVV